MSIIINGMNMPKGNSAKNLLIYSNGKVFTGHKDDANYSAEERKTGEWIVEDDGYTECCRCDQCGKRYVDISNFCPNCGADMRGGQDG